jgi:hypothetical protein
MCLKNIKITYTNFTVKKCVCGHSESCPEDSGVLEKFQGVHSLNITALEERIIMTKHVMTVRTVRTTINNKLHILNPHLQQY